MKNSIKFKQSTFKFHSLSIVGTQWGDEGKGKITNYLSQTADVVVRYQGGDNAGHSIVINGKRYALHIIPSGIFNPKIKNVLANGVVINPIKLVEELEQLKSQGITNFQLAISEIAHLIFPYHIAIDTMNEDQKAARKIGTTKRGIGPAYSDKIARDGIRFIDVLDDKLFRSLLETNLQRYNQILKLNNQPTLEFGKIYDDILRAVNYLRPFIVNASILVYDELIAGKRVLFEGAQGIMLDIDHGSYPFVTSSSPTSSSIFTNVGIPAWTLRSTLGVAKAYTTRVGTGALPTEFEDEIAKQIREIGHEYGTTTKRPRRIGWFDAVIIRHAARISGLNGLSITLLDVLSNISTLKICVNYELNGELIDYLPNGEANLENVKPVYLELAGWNDDITNIKSFAELPRNAQIYLKTIEKVTNLPIIQFSVGPDQRQTVDLEPIW